HSHFGGSFVVQGLRAIGEKDVIYHRNLNNGKAVRRVPKRNRQAHDLKEKRRSALNVRLFLREFCVDFLENCYNRLMYLVKVSKGNTMVFICSMQESLIREQTQQHDETYYLWALSFFMAFNRGNGFRAELVSETMSIRTFYFIERNVTNYYEMLLTDRKEATSWSRREIFLTLLRKYDETKQPQSYLRDLVESTHLFLRMLERFCKGRKNLIVQVSGIAFLLSASLTESIVPFDAASETPPEEQRTEAMIRVQDALLARLGPEALALLRAAREVWPDGDVFGSSDVEPEEELDLLKQIFHANLPMPDIVETVIQLLSNSNRTRRQVVTQLVHMDVLGNIMKKLTAKRSRARIVEKLLSMGLVSERRELYKKRSRGAHKQSSRKGMVGLSQPVPLVPFAEANEDAMDNKNFLKLLRKLGIRPPENEQVCL
ncbi:hypothetical protein GOODEAATRI_018015, partial [Goodea atripinnis]